MLLRVSASNGEATIVGTYAGPFEHADHAGEYVHGLAGADAFFWYFYTGGTVLAYSDYLDTFAWEPVPEETV
jgi:hypothetical protein